MKKTELKLLAMLLTVILLAGCTSQMDRDANKMAKRVVEFEQVQKRMEDRSNLGGERMSEQDFQQYAKEYMEYANKMLENYSETPDQKHEFYQLVEKKAKEMKNK